MRDLILMVAGLAAGNGFAYVSGNQTAMVICAGLSVLAGVLHSLGSYARYRAARLNRPEQP